MEETEFAFSEAQFKKICALLYEHAGIALSDQKKSMVYSRLARRLRALQLRDFADYLSLLNSDQGDQEWQHFVNALTTNLTSFFREEHHFHTLAALLPDWLQAYGQVRIWCAAASTGEEPYSLAITAAEALHSLHAPVQIWASDIDTDVLRRAATGVYPLKAVEQLSLERKRAFFLRGRGQQEGQVRVRDELRHMLLFEQINLLDSLWRIEAPLDAIFCRNVFIYFDRPTQERLLERFASLLRPEGRLFLGHSEVLGQGPADF